MQFYLYFYYYCCQYYYYVVLVVLVLSLLLVLLQQLLLLLLLLLLEFPPPPHPHHSKGGYHRMGGVPPNAVSYIWILHISQTEMLHLISSSVMFTQNLFILRFLPLPPLDAAFNDCAASSKSVSQSAVTTSNPAWAIHETYMGDSVINHHQFVCLSTTYETSPIYYLLVHYASTLPPYRTSQGQ